MARLYLEPTARNLLRKPLVFGVSFIGLCILAFIVLFLNVILGTGTVSSFITLAVAIIGYFFLRVITKFSKNGWEEEFIFKLEKWLEKKEVNGSEVFSETTLNLISCDIDVKSEDTLSVEELLDSKESLISLIREIKEEAFTSFVGTKNQFGFQFFKVKKPIENHNTFSKRENNKFAYSLYQLPVTTDPLWMIQLLNKIESDFKVYFRVKALNFYQIKSKIEHARKINSRDDSRVSNIDSEVSFEEASKVLEGLSRGDEKIYEISLVIISNEPLTLDKEYFCEEKNLTLTLASVTGLRKRAFRTLLVRECTLCDLIPNFLDPKEEGKSILTTRRGNPLYFSPLDKRLEALHWLVAGASGSGKSFFTGVILNRLIKEGEEISVLFIDHNRSFKRLVENNNGNYSEPESLSELKKAVCIVVESLNKPFTFAGIELSDLNLSEKKDGTHFVLSIIEQFLRSRSTFHPVYIVLDECWNFMRDEPVLVQRAFREFRKLNGAAVAITQSLGDFLSDESGQSIFQNAPIRILLRQGEDVSRYQGILGLNSKEASLLKSLKSKRRVFSECLIKTPFSSKLGRLYPTESEHALSRTDNLREEFIKSLKQKSRFPMNEASIG